MTSPLIQDPEYALADAMKRADCGLAIARRAGRMMETDEKLRARSRELLSEARELLARVDQKMGDRKS